MSDSSEDANAQRAQRLFIQALQVAQIEERNDGNQFPGFVGGISVYWQKIGDDIELEFNCIKWWSGRLRTSISLKGVAEQVARLFHDDADAVQALVDSLKYIQATISELLPRINQELIARSFYSLNKTALSANDRRVLKNLRTTIIEPVNLAFEERRKELVRQLRAEQGQRWHGGSEPEIDVSDEQCARLSADYPTLLKHWRNVKTWRKEKTNWRDHAKLDFPDTPDDLLDRLDDDLLSQFDSDGEDYPNIPSVLAHEHAARRCGIPANSYSLSTLSRLRRRGNKVRVQSNATND
jgi:hypothetical protein